MDMCVLIVLHISVITFLCFTATYFLVDIVRLDCLIIGFRVCCSTDLKEGDVPRSFFNTPTLLRQCRHLSDSYVVIWQMTAFALLYIPIKSQVIYSKKPKTSIFNVSQRVF